MRVGFERSNRAGAAAVSRSSPLPENYGRSAKRSSRADAFAAGFCPPLGGAGAYTFRPPQRSSPVLRTERHNRAYRPRILGALAASLLALVVAFRLWPVPDAEPLREVYAPPPKEAVVLEEIVPTRQVEQAPPPPAPLPPIEVPDDVEVEEIDLPELDLDFNPGPTPVPPPVEAPPGPVESEGDDVPAFVEDAEVRPRVVRAVVPDYPQEAERRDIRARVAVRVLVDRQGRVEEAEIVDRIRLDKKDREERVAELGYGIEEAVLAAARELRFRPGRERGQPVRTYTVVTLRVGV